MVSLTDFANVHYLFLYVTPVRLRSTCHVYLEPEVFDKLEEPTDDENDMLDLAFGLTEQYVLLLLRPR